MLTLMQLFEVKQQLELMAEQIQPANQVEFTWVIFIYFVYFICTVYLCDSWPR
jgi:hypothetical protein